MQMNWIAFALAVVAQMAVGYVWFLPGVMGKMWARANGSTMEEMKPQNMGMTMGVTILLTLLFTFWLNINVNGPGQEEARYATFQHGIAHAVALTLFVVLPLFGTPALYEKRGWNWVLVHAGYWFVRMAVAMGILSLMR